MDRDFRKRSKGGLGAKGGADGIDLVSCGEMQRSGGLGYLPGVACAAGLLHLVWVRWVGDEADVGLVLRCSLWVPSVATGAGEIVVGVESDLPMTALAAGRAGRYFLNGWLSRSLVLPTTGKGQDEQVEK